jgi:hypothetical protein
LAELPRVDDPKPGFRWPVAVTGVIAKPPGEVWQAISSPGNLELCHPHCDRNPVHAWPGAASIDEVHYLSGLVFERRFLRWIEGVGYDLEIGRRGGRTSYVSWRILPVDGGRSVLRIAVYPHVLQHLPVAVRWLPHLVRVRPMLTKYLSSVVGGFEWYVTCGEAVPRDHFGSHPWFSAHPGASIRDMDSVCYNQRTASGEAGRN